MGEIKEMSKTTTLPSRKKIDLELLHQILGHRSTSSFLSGDTANIWENIDPRIDTDSFCASCQISSMNKWLGLKFNSIQIHHSSGFYGYNTINITQKFDK